MNDKKPNALATRLAVEKAHPEIRMTTPLTSQSGMWELEIGDNDTTFYDDIWLMFDYLANKFGDIEALT